MTRSIRSISRAATSLAALLSLSACQSTELQLSLLVPDGVDPRHVNLDRASEGETVEARGEASIFFLFPLGDTSLDALVEQATDGRDDVVLVDIEVRRTFWWALLFGKVHRELRAVRVPLPKAGPDEPHGETAAHGHAEPQAHANPQELAKPQELEGGTNAARTREDIR